MATLATTSACLDNSGEPGGSERQVVINFNAACVDILAIANLLNQLQTASLYRALGNPGFVLSSNFDVKNGAAISYLNGGTLKTLSVNTNFDTGTSQVIVADKWSAALLSVDSTGSAALTWSATLNAASEAAAIAALPALPAATNTPLGYVTVLTGSGVTWTAGTDALASGTGGTPATTTNYYNSVNVNSAQIGSAVVLTAAKVGNMSGTAITV